MIVISQASNIPGLFFSKKPLTHKNKHRHSDLSWSCLPSVCIHGKFSQTPHWSYTYLFWATRGDCADFRFSMLTRCDGRFADPSTTPHDHTWSLLLTHAAQAQTKLENDACRPSFYSQNKRTKPAPNQTHFSRRVSRTHMVTLAHTYILTCTPHTYTRTDYHSVYTHTHLNSVCTCRQLYTNTYKLCVLIRKHAHKHMQTLCVYT